ncbi:hypothetical protein SDC9_153980 [bioreactor metagenome]|uniref:Recombinase zinc beta ribbon domain-containing protein n=1 Tax=bioreactor metagenome TaxID=1076179 RepID=A0A645F296_9ZZZZ
MVGESGSGRNGNKHFYYTCAKRKREKACDKKTVKKDWIENLVVSETVKNILQPERIEYISRRCVEIQINTKSENHELDRLKKQLSETKKAIDNMMSAIEQGIITKNTKTRLIELEQAQEKIEFEIATQRINQPDLTEQQIKYMLSRFKRETSEPLEKYNADVINCFVNRVYLYDDKLYITYNLTDTKGELFHSELSLLNDPESCNSYAIYKGSDLEQSPPP